MSRRSHGRRRTTADEQLFEPAGSTLEDIVLGAWEDLAARGSTECLVCHAELGSTQVAIPAGPSSAGLEPRYHSSRELGSRGKSPQGGTLEESPDTTGHGGG